MIRSAGYLRVSDEEQIDGYSLDAQERAYLARAETNGWTSVAVYRDEGRSAYRRDVRRPAFDQLLRDVRAGRIDLVWVHRSSRFTRRTGIADGLLDEFEKLGIQYVVDSMPVDRSTPFGWASHQMNSVFDELFSRQVAFDTKRGLREKALQGGWVGPAPLGYQKDSEGQLVPSPDAPAVQRIFELYATGRYSHITVADALNADGWRALNWQTGDRRLFGRESIRTILKNRAYLGYVSCGGEEFTGAHQALITQALWDAVHRVRDDRTRLQERPSLAPALWLTGRVWCESCGRRMWAHTSGRQGSFGYYRCSGVPSRVCTERMIRATTLEDEVLDLLSLLVIPDSRYPIIVEEAQRMIQAANQPKAETVDRDAIQRKLRRLAQAYADELIDDATYTHDRDMLKALLVDAPIPITYTSDPERMLSMLQDVPTLLKRATPEKRKMVMQNVFERVWTRDRVLYGVAPRPEMYPLIAAIARNSNKRGVSGVADGRQSASSHIIVPFPGRSPVFILPTTYQPHVAA